MRGLRVRAAAVACCVGTALLAAAALLVAPGRAAAGDEGEAFVTSQSAVGPSPSRASAWTSAIANSAPAFIACIWVFGPIS